MAPAAKKTPAKKAASARKPRAAKKEDTTDMAETSATTFQLPAVLDLNASKPLYESLTGMKGNDIVLDASQVERIGGQCLQVLLAARASWQAQNNSVKVENPSEAFETTLHLLGVNHDNLLLKEIQQ